jgi:hypothetical protein
MEAQIRAQRRKRQVWWYYEASVDQSQTPIQDADDDLNWGRHKGEVVLCGKAIFRERLRR